MRKLSFVVVLGFLLAASACGGNGGGAADGGTADVTEGDDDLGMTDQAAADIPEADVAADCNPNWVLQFFAIEDGMALTSNKQYSVQAQLFNPVSGEWLAGETITFAVSGDGSASFQNSEGTTNANGVAEATLETGSDEGMEYTLTISHQCVAPVSIKVQVQQPAMGSLFVALEVSDEVLLIDPGPSLEVYVDELSTLCAAAVYTDPLGQKVPFPPGETSVEIPNVVAGPAYIVVAVARDLGGQVIGAACGEGVNVLVDKTTEVSLVLAPLALDPTGTYQFQLKADLATLLLDEQVDPGVTLLDLATGAGAAVTEAIVDDLAPWFEEGFPEECGDVPAAIAAGVDSTLEGYPPTGVADAAEQSASLLDSLLDSVTVAGKLDLQPAPESAFLAELEYQSVTFSGQLPCDGCEAKLTVTKDLFDLGEIHLQLGEQSFELTPEGYDQFTVSAFDFGISPGRFKVYAFVNLVLPSLGIEDAIDGVFPDLIDCEAVVDAVDEETMNCLTFNSPQIDPIASCESAVAGLTDEFYLALAGYTAPQHLACSGTGQFNDQNGDLEADELSVSLSGDFMHDGESAGTFMYPLTAEK